MITLYWLALIFPTKDYKVRRHVGSWAPTYNTSRGPLAMLSVLLLQPPFISYQPQDHGGLYIVVKQHVVLSVTA